MTTPGDASSQQPEPEPYVSPFADLDKITRDLQRGVRMALLIHKKLGHSIATWDEEAQAPKVLPPEEIPVEDAEFEGEPLILPWW